MRASAVNLLSANQSQGIPGRGRFSIVKIRLNIECGIY